MASILTVYIRRQAIGNYQDFGPGKVLASVYIDGKSVSLGFKADRRAAREAIEEAARDPPPPPPQAA